MRVDNRNCAALYGLNHLGPEGYHWRVCVEDKSAPGETGPKTFSWWDIQDENASLPIKEASSTQLSTFFGPCKTSDSSDSIASTISAKGAFKTLGKAMSQAVGHDASGVDQGGPTVKVIAFKLLDLVKMHDDFAIKNPGRVGGGRIPQPVTTTPTHPPTAPSRARSVQSSAPPPVPRPAPPAARASAPARVSQQQQHQNPQQRHATPSRPPTQQQQQQPRPGQEPSLMDFGTMDASSSLSGRPTPPSNETRAEKLKREYAQKNQTASRVWDDIDQRWVEADSVEKKGSSSTAMSSGGGSGSSSLLGGINGMPQKKEVGISLDASNAIGKSATVQAAVHSRVSDMKQSQEKALQEVREREERKKREESEEDEVRKRLEPSIKAWSEEHGKKKQLRALLATLHTILWPGSQWKQVTIGDLLDDKKVKLAFHKASRVVHPDKTHHLPAEQRFLAKRIFDALSQAKNELDNSK